MAENYFYSSLSGQEIENRLLGGVLFNTDQTLTSSQKAIARANIGAGESNSTFKILGYFDTLQDLQEWLQILPEPGDAYGIGTSSPYDIYVWDGAHSTWVNNGPIVLSDALIDDEDISTEHTWSSTKINTELSGKQNKITANGLLKGNGSGGVSAAVAGTDYLTPATNYSPVVNINSDYTPAASDSGKTIILGTSVSGNVTITINQAVLGSLPFGAEIAFVKDNLQGNLARLKIVNIGFGNEGAGWISPNANGVYAVIPERYGMITLKKMFNADSAMMLFGNVEVVT